MSLLKPQEVERRIAVWEKYGRSAHKAAHEIGINRRNMDRFLDRYAADQVGTHTHGRLDQTLSAKLPLPPEGKVTRYLLTCAQNNTKVHRGFLTNLEAYAQHIGAHIKISRFTYNKAAYAGARKAGDDAEDKETYYDPAILPYVSDDIELLAPTLAWAGNLQISPTAVSPLSGFADYTGEASTIIPHTRVEMRPVATPRSSPTKHLYTTGAVTLKNYIMAKAGQKAEFHHTFGALIVEVLPGGQWFVRQLMADSRGAFQDHPYKVTAGSVTEDAEVAAIQWGDIHVANIDPKIKKMFWGPGGVLDTLKPKKQLFHDLVDGESHNAHTQADHHQQFQNHATGRNLIREEFSAARTFVDDYAQRDWCQGIVVWSNHDEFLVRYLRSTDYRRDFPNAIFILELELAAYQAMEAGDKPSLFSQALNSKKCRVMTDDEGGQLIEGIAYTYHGHVGAGGSRGSVQQFARLGLKTMTGHSHAAWLIAGASSAGTCSKLYLGYNNGPSTWSHTFTILYRGGKRQQVTANAELGIWRAA